MSADPVVVSLKDLESVTVPYKQLEKLFDEDSLGIIVVKDLPAEYHDLRLSVLTKASQLAKLPQSVLSTLEDEEAVWLVGWSLGREKLNNKPDLYKGSYYINCSFYQDIDKEGPTAEETEGFDHMKLYTSPNRWPLEELIPGFKRDCKELIKLIIDVSVHVAENCDKYCEDKITGYEPHYLSNIVANSYTTKARLLHYFPNTDSSTAEEWCGEHLDHSCLTGLTSALFIDESTNQILTDIDDDSGLFIKNRKGQTVKVDIPTDCLAFQTGSCLQEVSNGNFKLVPHFVKTGKLSQNVARNTLAVFCQPSLQAKVNLDESFAQYCQRILKANH